MISDPPSPTNSVLAMPGPGRNTGGCTEPVRMTSPARRDLPWLDQLVGKPGERDQGAAHDVGAGAGADFLVLEQGAALYAGEVERPPVLDLGADDAGRLQHVVGDAAGSAHLGDVGVAVLHDFSAAIEVGDERLDRLGGVGGAAGGHILRHARHHLALDTGLDGPALFEHRAALADAALIDAGEDRARRASSARTARAGSTPPSSRPWRPCHRPSGGRGRRTAPCRNWPRKELPCQRRGSP